VSPLPPTVPRSSRINSCAVSCGVFILFSHLCTHVLQGDASQLNSRISIQGTALLVRWWDLLQRWQWIGVSKELLAAADTSSTPWNNEFVLFKIISCSFYYSGFYIFLSLSLN
jgi:hypothetical protein